MKNPLKSAGNFFSSLFRRVPQEEAPQGYPKSSTRNSLPVERDASDVIEHQRSSEETPNPPLPASVLPIDGGSSLITPTSVPPENLLGESTFTGVVSTQVPGGDLGTSKPQNTTSQPVIRRDAKAQDYLTSLIHRVPQEEDPRTRMNWASRSDSPVELLELLSNDQDRDIAVAAAKNHAHTSKSLERLSSHSDERVRFEVARHPNVTRFLLQALAQDVSEIVQVEAREQLASTPDVFENDYKSTKAPDPLLSIPVPLVDGSNPGIKPDPTPAENLSDELMSTGEGSAPVPREDHRVLKDQRLLGRHAMYSEAKATESSSQVRDGEQIQEDISADLSKLSLSTPADRGGKTVVTSDVQVLAEHLLNIVSSAAPIDQVTLYERYASQNKLLMDNDLEKMLTTALKHLSNRKLVNRIVTTSERSLGQKSNILIELRKPHEESPKVPLINKPTLRPKLSDQENYSVPVGAKDRGLSSVVSATPPEITELATKLFAIVCVAPPIDQVTLVEKFAGQQRLPISRDLEHRSIKALKYLADQHRIRRIIRKPDLSAGHKSSILLEPIKPVTSPLLNETATATPTEEAVERVEEQSPELSFQQTREANSIDAEVLYSRTDVDGSSDLGYSNGTPSEALSPPLSTEHHGDQSGVERDAHSPRPVQKKKKKP